MFWSLWLSEVLHNKGHGWVEDHLGKTMLDDLTIICEKKGSPWDQIDRKWWDHTPNQKYTLMNWKYNTHFKHLESTSISVSLCTSVYADVSPLFIQAADVAAPRTTRANNCVAKPLEMAMRARLIRDIRIPSCRTPFAPYLSIAKPAGILKKYVQQRNGNVWAVNMS